MAIFPNLSVATPQGQAVDQLTDHLAGVSITVPASDGNGNCGMILHLNIPIDDDHQGKPALARPRREPLRRDSMKRREALLKGKEGSRRRQRWENDRLLNNPYFEPPLPSDYAPGPTYPRHGTVPYYLAPLWDAELAARKKREEKHRERAREAKKAKGVTSVDGREDVGKIPRELREKLKRARGAKGLLQGLEEEVRGFLVRAVEERERRGLRERSGSLVVVGEESDESDEEGGVVLVGKDGGMEVLPPSPKRGMGGVMMDKLVCCGEVGDRGATFGRWLVHAIGRYYGLRTWSITVGNPPRREAYVGIVREREEEERRRLAQGLPRPLWGQL